MKKLITLLSFTKGTTESFITGEIRKVGTPPFSKEQTGLIIKNIVELHNAGVKKLSKDEGKEEK